MAQHTPDVRRRRVLRILLAAGLAIVLATGAYVGYAAIRAAQPVTLPASTGPFRVGRTITEWTDSARVDPLAPAPGTPRRLAVWLWYPATPGPGATPAPYTPGPWAGLHLGGPMAWAETRFDEVRVHAVADAPVAAGRFPVVVLEPGMGLAAPQYTTIAEDLASHGYLVAGVTPTYSANLTVLGGTPVTADEAGTAPDADDLHAGAAQAAGDRLVEVWAADARFAAGQVAAQAGFAGHADPARTVYIGHSFGGAAALEACHGDPHCSGAADLDGTQYGSVVHSGLDKPVLILGSQDSCVTGTCRATPADRSDQRTALSLLTAGPGPAWCDRLAGTAHFNFTDYGAYYLAAPAELLIALGPADGAEALTRVDDRLRAFADHVTANGPAPPVPACATR